MHAKEKGRRCRRPKVIFLFDRRNFHPAVVRIQLL
jgi:hypothetical protein